MSFDLPGVKPGSDIETLFKTVGFVTVQWGLAEQSLDLMVASIFPAFKGRTSFKRRPQFLEPKVEFLTKCFTEIPELDQFRDESETLLPRFLVAGKRRNELIHGAISEISIEDDAFMFLKLDIKSNEHHVRQSYLQSLTGQFFEKNFWPWGGMGSLLHEECGIA